MIAGCKSDRVSSGQSIVCSAGPRTSSTSASPCCSCRRRGPPARRRGTSCSTCFDDFGSDVVVEVLDTLLLVFVFVELLGAVRVTIREQKLVAEPFLLVGIIASIKEIVVCRSAAERSAAGAGVRGGDVEVGVLAGRDPVGDRRVAAPPQGARTRRGSAAGVTTASAWFLTPEERGNPATEIDRRRGDGRGLHRRQRRARARPRRRVLRTAPRRPRGARTRRLGPLHRLARRPRRAARRPGHRGGPGPGRAGGARRARAGPGVALAPRPGRTSARRRTCTSSRR